MSDRTTKSDSTSRSLLREALERTLDVYAAISEPEVADAEAEVRAAARRFLALTETGPDYEAAHIAYEDQYNDMDENGINIHAIVDAALADYLTEEETK